MEAKGVKVTEETPKRRMSLREWIGRLPQWNGKGRGRDGRLDQRLEWWEKASLVPWFKLEKCDNPRFSHP